MPDRLPWQRAGERTFIAYPMGEAQPRFYAMVRYNGALPEDAGRWEWNATARPVRPYAPGDVVALFGNEPDRQAAADAATAAWPVVVEMARRRGIGP